MEMDWKSEEINEELNFILCKQILKLDGRQGSVARRNYFPHLLFSILGRTVVLMLE
jgi:hypothetical protein